MSKTSQIGKLNMMKHRPVRRPPVEAFPVDPWRLVERGFTPGAVPLTETLFALANGYLGIRGSFEEGMPSHEHGTFINGFHETWPIVHAEEAYGLVSVGQTIATLPDATAITLYVDDEPMILAHGRLLAHERRLDLRRGVLERDLEWESPSGSASARAFRASRLFRPPSPRRIPFRGHCHGWPWPVGALLQACEPPGRGREA